ncbi:MAG: metallophosphoesterase [Myxococcota bacterium]
MSALRLAVLGDVHQHFGAEDVEALDGGGYDAVLFVGDLASYTEGGGLRTARRIAALRTPAYMIPGNHDGTWLPQLAVETFPKLFGARPYFGHLQAWRVARLRRALGPVRLVAYERLDLGSHELLAARPHSSGGPGLAFRTHLAKAHGVGDLDASAERLRTLVRGATKPLIVLAHNGPTGLGEGPEDPCGRDFAPEARSLPGDWGDRDLRAALDAAPTPPQVVCFGHMHHDLKTGGTRRWQTRDAAGTLHVNAARVPRIDAAGRRHHVRLVLPLGGGPAQAEEIWV